MTAADVVAALDLQRHPEGGWFRETHRDPACTLIYFLLAEGEVSWWHRVTHAAEIWLHHEGAPLELAWTADRSAPVTVATLGCLCRQAVVPPGAWQAARSLGAWTLVSCVVAPPFAFERFELAPPAWRPLPFER